MQTKIRQAIRRSPIPILLRRTYWCLRGRLEYRLVADETFVARRYRQTTGHTLDLVNPQRFTEKLQWLKLFYRNELMRQCSDKYEVRNYVSESGFAHLLNEICGVYRRYQDIDLDALPSRFVLKATHGSGWNLIVKDKASVNWRIWRRIMAVWQSTNLAWFGREWNYEAIEPRFIVEKYLEDDSGQLRDYKVMCLNGEPVWMQVDEGRFGNPKRKYLDPEGNEIHMADRVNGGFAAQTRFGGFEHQFNLAHRRMFEIAQHLSDPFPCVRVDFYLQNDRIIFGELTFFDGSGFYSLSPDEYDLKFGGLLQLPAANHNQDILERMRGSCE